VLHEKEKEKGGLFVEEAMVVYF